MTSTLTMDFVLLTRVGARQLLNTADFVSLVIVKQKVRVTIPQTRKVANLGEKFKVRRKYGLYLPAAAVRETWHARRVHTAVQHTMMAAVCSAQGPRHGAGELASRAIMSVWSGQLRQKTSSSAVTRFPEATQRSSNVNLGSQKRKRDPRSAFLGTKLLPE